eukprot:1579036-Amphidinium_carterae.1
MMKHQHQQLLHVLEQHQHELKQQQQKLVEIQQQVKAVARSTGLQTAAACRMLSACITHIG